MTVNVIHFSSDSGKHAAVPVLGQSNQELASLIVASTPAIMTNSTQLTKRDFSVSWLSYNYDNCNKDLCMKWYNDASSDMTDEAADIATDFEFFVLRNEGWKYCFDVITDEDNVEPQASNSDSGEVGTAVYGEIYFNTYGGIYGQCNSFYDCTTSDCN